ncbi:hypothetical protein Adt_15502 [Abeliophyllum distichum]|uniref:Uncharacterized protein n=1 Tax=Abeliophyllum distichum TaxID=126358 RepID=A0ABD1U2M4_9LAMI
MHNLPKATNKDGLKDKKEDGMGDLMEELPKSSSGRSKFERSKKDENEDDLRQSITIQFGTLPPVLANNYLLANEFKSKENEERKVRIPRFEKYGSPPRILPPLKGWVTREELQEESDREVQKAEDQCKILHVNLVQEVDLKEDKQEVEIEAAEKCLVFWNDKGEVEVVQTDHKLFVAEANSVERFMYEENYGPVRVVQKGEETRIVAQSEESFSLDAFTEMFGQMRPNIVALKEPVIGKKTIKKC